VQENAEKMKPKRRKPPYPVIYGIAKDLQRAVVNGKVEIRIYYILLEYLKRQ